MKADKIPDIIRSLDSGKMKYQCVMVSGDWGIGKSYQLNKAIKETDPVGYCSLFGVKSIDDVYEQLVFRLTFNSEKFHLNFKELSDDLDLGKLNPIKNILSNFISARSVFDFLLAKRDDKGKTTLLIFDDIERIGDNFDFDLFLGTVDTLILEHNDLKVVFVANPKQFSKGQKAIWDKYSEKVVDKIFHIDELADEICILDDPEENDFAINFMKRHGTNNLRTLKKANGFFSDVLQKINANNSQLSIDGYKMQVLRTICYSITFESIEKIYEKEGKRKSKEAAENKETLYQKTFLDSVYGTFEHRIYHKYLKEIIAGNNVEDLVAELSKYASCGNGNFDIICSSLASVKRDKKPIYLCSDSEVQLYIPEQRKRIEKNDFKNFYDFLKCVDDIFVCSKFQGLDTSDLNTVIKNKAAELYAAEEHQWSLDTYCERLSSSELKEILYSIEDDFKKSYFWHVFEELSETIDAKDYKTAFDLLCKIHGSIHDSVFIGAIDEESLLTALCNESLLPLGNCSEWQYYSMQTAYEIGIELYKEKYGNKLQKAIDKFSSDKMFNVRMNNILNDHNNN